MLAFHAANANGTFADSSQPVYKWYYYAQEFHAQVAAWWTEWDTPTYTDALNNGDNGYITDTTNWTRVSTAVLGDNATNGSYG